MKISDIKLNNDNPRYIKDDKFEKLKASIQSFPQMLRLRPIVIDENNIVLGGNMRLRALQELGYTELDDEWVKLADELTAEQKREFIIKDNVGFGSWEWETLANEWDSAELAEWGLEMWDAGSAYNDMHEDQVDEDQEFDPIGVSSGLQKIVFVFDGEDEADSFLNSVQQKANKTGQKGIWTVDLSTQSI
jgi:hypothetical protein